jgi:ApaG protein
MSAEGHIRVHVDTQYVADQSVPEESRYVFAYTVTIHNAGNEVAQLISRHWIITDANGGTSEVEGEGVVGEKPTLRPGEGFRYTSGAILETPVGSMRGTYHLVDKNGQPFEAPIAAFTLAVPGMLH